MAEEPREGGKKSSLIKYGILFVVAFMVPVITGLVIAWLVLIPRLAGEAVEEAPVADVDAFPIDMQEVIFDEISVSVQSDDPDVVPPVLMVQVALSCSNAATAAKIEAKKSYFAAEILKFHQGRTRDELNDPLVQNSILEQIKQQSNRLLKQMDTTMELTVLRAMHLKFMVVDI